jgi:transposase InsO family protein
LTYIATGEGWLYMAAIMDLHTRKIVGWAMRDHLRAELAISALLMAIQRQRPGAGLIQHSDRGIQGGFQWSSQHRDGGRHDGWETAFGSGITGEVPFAWPARDGTA